MTVSTPVPRQRLYETKEGTACVDFVFFSTRKQKEWRPSVSGTTGEDAQHNNTQEVVPTTTTVTTKEEDATGTGIDNDLYVESSTDLPKLPPFLRDDDILLGARGLLPVQHNGTQRCNRAIQSRLPLFLTYPQRTKAMVASIVQELSQSSNDNNNNNTSGNKFYVVTTSPYKASKKWQWLDRTERVGQHVTGILQHLAVVYRQAKEQREQKALEEQQQQPLVQQQQQQQQQGEQQSVVARATEPQRKSAHYLVEPSNMYNEIQPSPLKRRRITSDSPPTTTTIWTTKTTRHDDLTQGFSPQARTVHDKGEETAPQAHEMETVAKDAESSVHNNGIHSVANSTLQQHSSSGRQFDSGDKELNSEMSTVCQTGSNERGNTSSNTPEGKDNEQVAKPNLGETVPGRPGDLKELESIPNEAQVVVEEDERAAQGGAIVMGDFQPLPLTTSPQKLPGIHKYLEPAQVSRESSKEITQMVYKPRHLSLPCSPYRPKRKSSENDDNKKRRLVLGVNGWETKRGTPLSAKSRWDKSRSSTADQHHGPDRPFYAFSHGGQRTWERQGQIHGKGVGGGSSSSSLCPLETEEANIVTPPYTKVPNNEDCLATKRTAVSSDYHSFHSVRDEFSSPAQEIRPERKVVTTDDHQGVLASVLIEAHELEPERYVDPTENDVLLGRGGRSNFHPGNKRFRELADSSAERYGNTCSKGEAYEISEELVEKVHMKLKGKFLKLDTLTNRWYEVDRHEARRKCAQKLREGVSSLKKCKAASPTGKPKTSLDLMLPDELTSDDVLLGPDSVRANHAGTLRFHKLLKMYLPNYFRGSTVHANILNHVQDRGGRFYARHGSGWQLIEDSSIVTSHVQRLLEKMKFIAEKREVPHEIVAAGRRSNRTKWLKHFESIIRPCAGEFDVVLAGMRFFEVSTPGNSRFRMMMENHFHIFQAKDHHGRRNVAHFILQYFLMHGARFYLPNESLGVCHHEVNREILVDEIINHFPFMSPPRGHARAIY
eukprot:scaffold6164_cov163-Amphora_coffeaeformis.AAC.17